MDALWVKILVPALTAFFGAFAGWFFKRKRMALENSHLASENKKEDIQTIDAAVATWQKVVDALEEQISKLLDQRKGDAERIDTLSARIVELQDKVDDLQNRLRITEKLEKKVARYEKLLADHGIAY